MPLCEIVFLLMKQKLLAQAQLSKAEPRVYKLSQLVSGPCGMLQKTIFVCPASHCLPLLSGNWFEGNVRDNCRLVASHSIQQKIGWNHIPVVGWSVLSTVSSSDLGHLHMGQFGVYYHYLPALFMLHMCQKPHPQHSDTRPPYWPNSFTCPHGPSE